MLFEEFIVEKLFFIFYDIIYDSFAVDART